MHNLINWVIETLNATAFSAFIMTSPWFFPMLEMLHFLGLSLLFGSLLVVDLRVAGIARNVPIIRVESYIRFALIGFAINLTTGLIFIIGDSDRYLINVAFWTKMCVILVAGLNTAYFVRRVKPQIEMGRDVGELTPDARFVAIASLVLWTAVIILGRFMPYVEE